MKTMPIGLSDSTCRRGVRNITWPTSALRRWVAAIALLLIALSRAPVAVFGAEPVWEAWRQKRMLPEDDSRLMLKRFVDRQLVPLPVPADRAAWEAARPELHRRVVAALGLTEFIANRPVLRVEQKGALQRDGYRIEKLTYESYPGMAVPALLYVPDKIPGKVPGIASIAGHAYGPGKTSDFLQQRNVNLARRGCVVLTYDYQGTGERNTGPDPMHGKPYGGGNDHGIRSFSHSTRNPSGLEVLDAIRALDVLEARPEVDRDRLAFTGESGGGNSTYWIAAVDPRVKLAAPVSSVTTFDYWIDHDRNWDWHQRPFGVRRFADIGVLLALHAPRPLLVITSLRRTDDNEFPFEEADRSFHWAQQVYEHLGHKQAIVHVESPTGHGYQEDKRKLFYAAVEKSLGVPFPQGDRELPVQVDSFDDLRCGLPPGNLTFRDVFEKWLAPLPRKIEAAEWDTPAALRKFLRERLALPGALPKAPAKLVGTENQGELSAEFWLIETEPGIRLPAVLIGAKGSQAPVQVAPGRDAGVIERALKANARALAFDVRGAGEVAEGEGRLKNLGWFIGRPLAGMQAYDILQAARFCRDQKHAAKVELHSGPQFGWAALLAAASEPESFSAGRVTIPFVSLREQIQQLGDRAVADVPGLYEHLDVDQLRTLWPQGEVAHDVPAGAK